MVAILIAGASRGRWQKTVAGIASDGVANVRAKVRVGASPPPPPPDEPPSSIAAPFLDK